MVLAVAGGVLLLILVAVGAFLAGRGGGDAAPARAERPAASVADALPVDAAPIVDGTEASTRAADAARALASEEVAAPAPPPPPPEPVAAPAPVAVPVAAPAPVAVPAPVVRAPAAPRAALPAPVARPSPPPAPPAPSGRTRGTATGAAPAPVVTTAEVGGSFAVRVSAPGREARVRCGDGQAAEFSGATSLSFTSMQTCVVQIGHGRGALTVSGGCSAICTEENGRVTCTGC
jgi:hypothetical protein